jgi:succinate dehydrogenase/fumarate reductase flavoprotein subunit
MGAWGIGIFEDDTGCDTRDDIAEAADPVAELDRRLRRVSMLDRSEYFESEYCFDALVPAAIVDAYVHGTSYKGLEEFRGQHPRLELHSLASLAAAAVARVLEPSAEIHELWAENEEDYPEWKRSLEDLQSRLMSVKPRS